MLLIGRYAYFFEHNLNFLMRLAGYFFNCCITLLPVGGEDLTAVEQAQPTADRPG